MARFLALTALLLAVGCQSASDYGMHIEALDEAGYEMAEEPPPPAPPTARAALQIDPNDVAHDDEPEEPTERQLIRRATLRLRVDDYADARTQVGTLAEQSEAYIGGEEERRYPGRIENTLTLRVDAARFESFMEALIALGDELDFRTVEVEDVTRQYVDLEARLGARQAVAERLTALLARANTVTDVLAVQSQLAEVQEEIDSAEGQLRFLRNQVSLSTITLTLFEETNTGLIAGPSFLSRIGRAFEAGWDGLLGLIVGAIAVWPFWLLLALVVVLFRRFRRRRRMPTAL